MASNPSQASSWRQIAHCIASDIREGFVEITRHGLAVVGLAVIAVSVMFATRPDMQAAANEFLRGWFHSQQNDAENALRADNSMAEPGASRSTAAAIQTLTPEQLKVTQWLSRKYRISTEPMAALVTEAWREGERLQVPPTLILAVIAAESNFNPFAQRTDSHRGLMQIDSQSQHAALSRFGGPLSVFDPLTNVRVGSRLLQSFISQAGSIEGGLRAYAKTSPQAADGTYMERVLSEHKLLERLIQPQATAASNPSPAANKQP